MWTADLELRPSTKLKMSRHSTIELTSNNTCSVFLRADDLLKEKRKVKTWNDPYAMTSSRDPTGKECRIRKGSDYCNVIMALCHWPI